MSVLHYNSPVICTYLVQKGLNIEFHLHLQLYYSEVKFQIGKCEPDLKWMKCKWKYRKTMMNKTKLLGLNTQRTQTKNIITISSVMYFTQWLLSVLVTRELLNWSYLGFECFTEK